VKPTQPSRVWLEPVGAADEPEFAPELPKVTGWLLDAAELLAQPDPGPTPWLVEDLIVANSIVGLVTYVCEESGQPFFRAPKRNWR
jgi:hypothetical protein